MSLKSILVAIISVLMSSALLSAGTISGKVTYMGKPPAWKTIDMSSEPDCAKQYSTPPTTETVVAGANNVLQNVVVFISAGANDDKTQTQPVILEQKGCRYTPHVLALETGQEMKITNDDQTTHNVHPLAKENREWNRSQPPGAAPLTVKFDKPEFIPVKCNVHPWMRGYIVVLNTSHFAVTGGDGTFALPNLPAGKYTVTAWQEDFGSVTQDVTVTGNETETVDFNFKGKPN